MTTDRRQFGSRSGRRRRSLVLLPLGLGVLLVAACGHDDPPQARAAPRGPAASGGPTADAGPPGGANVIPASLPAAPRPTGPLPPDAGCITAECHAALSTARYVHGALSPGDCTVCHEPDQGDHTYPIRRPGRAGCTFCHTVSGTRLHQHEAMETSGCTGCHRPHVSDTKFLLTAPSVPELCAHCHVSERGAHPHGPFAAGECIACHQPHESNHANLLRGGDGVEHCFLCHTETKQAFAAAPYVHEPATESCTGCHDPHTSDLAYALKRPIDEMCFSCHEDLERQVAGSTAPHAAVFTGHRCANCHDPHVAGRPKLLRDRQDVLCLRCHDREIETDDGRTIPDMTASLNRRYLHGPVRSGDCTACHNVHGASHSRLLREEFTDAFYASFDLGNYALCFSCHESGLVTTERTDTLTDFRDGDRNLHFLHVNQERKGRTCRSCHAIHGSNLPKHLAETVPFEQSTWAMPIGFKKTESGGSCAPGCHELRTYSREKSPEAELEAPQGGPP